MAIDSKNLLVAVKAFSRGNPFPIDASSVWETKSEADSYAQAANAYGGQIVTALVDDKYKAFVLQPSEAGYTLEPIGVDASSVKQYVIIGARPTSNQEEGVIYIDGDIGYRWDGNDWRKIFADFSAEIGDFESRIGTLEENIDLKAPLVNPAFTGSVTIGGKEAATQEWVNSLIGQLNNGVPGIVDADTPLPVSGYTAGQSWRVAAAGMYAGQKCEGGDLIICLKDYETTFSNADFMVVQANIDGAVTGADASTDGHIVVFDGTTGKIIKDSNIAVGSLNDAIAKSHEHINQTVLDTFDKTQTEMLASAATDAQAKVDALSETIAAELAGKADAAQTYTKTEIDGKLTTITTNLNTKVDADTVDAKITAAKSEIETAYNSAIDTKIGDLGESADVVSYVNQVVGSGGADVSAQIDQAIKTSKEYTDAALSIIEF